MEELDPQVRLPAEVEEAARDPSRRLGPFVLLRELGRGGVGVVYLAYDVRLGRRIALKTLLDSSLEQFQRFSREGRAAAKLEHPGIVRILDMAVIGGRPCIAMEAVDGRSLKDLLHERHVRTRELVAVVRDAARALGHAHAQGIVHRDVKPGNVIVDAQGRGRVTDFGIARDEWASAEKLTATGTTLGTPAYMSPEQASDARRVGPWSDVYSLGAVLYEGITGRAPVVGQSDLEVLYKVMAGEVERPSALAEMPRELEAIIVKCLEREPSRRFTDGEALARELDRFLVQLEGKAKKRELAAATPEAPRSRAPLVAGAALLVLAGAAFAGWQLYSTSQRERATQQAIAAEALIQNQQREREAKRKAEEAKRRERIPALLAQARAERDSARKVALIDEALAAGAEGAGPILDRASALLAWHDGPGRDDPRLLERASADIARALTLEPRSSRAHYYDAQLHGALGEHALVHASLKAAASASGDVWSELARLSDETCRETGELRPGHLDRARALAQREPDEWEVWVTLGAYAAHLGHSGEALDALGKALERGAPPRTLFRRAAARRALGNLAGVEEDCTALLAQDARSAEAHVLRGEVRARRGNVAGAAEDARALGDFGAPNEARLLRARVRAARNDLDGALAEVAAVSSRAPAGLRARVGLFRAELLERKGDDEGAYRECDEIDDDQLVGEELTTYALLSARLEAVASGTTSDADDVLRHAEARFDPPRPELCAARAELALQGGRLQDAEEALARGRVHPARTLEACPEWTRVVALVQDRRAALEAAVTEASARAAARPHDLESVLECARLRLEGGDVARAAPELDRIHREGTPRQRARALVLRARVASPSEAKALLDEACRTDPSFPVAFAARAFLASRQHGEPDQDARVRADLARALEVGGADDGLARALRAATLVELEMSGALAESDAAARIAPEDRVVLELRAYVLERFDEVDPIEMARALEALAQRAKDDPVRAAFLARRARWFRAASRSPARHRGE